MAINYQIPRRSMDGFATLNEAIRNLGQSRAREKERQMHMARMLQDKEYRDKEIALRKDEIGQTTRAQDRLQAQMQGKAIADAREVYAKDPQGALAILQGVGFQGRLEDVFEPEAKTLPWQGGSALPDQLEQPQQPQQGPDAVQPPAFDQEEIDPRFAEEIGHIADQGQNYYDQKLAGKRLTAKLPQGQEIRLDPVEMRQLEQARRGQVAGDMGTAFEGDYQKLAMGMARAGIDPKEISMRVTRLMEQDAADERRLETEERRNEEFDRRYGSKEYRQSNMHMRSAIASGKLTAGQEEAARRGWHSQAESKLKSYLTSQGYQKQVQENQGYEMALANLESGLPAAQQAGIGAWVKAASGGSAVVTENEIQRYAERAMPWTEEMKRRFAYYLQGKAELPPGYVKPFTDAIRGAVLEKKKQQIQRIGAGARAIMANDPNPEIQALADQAYLQAVSPLMSEEELQEAARPKDNPLVRGAKAQKDRDRKAANTLKGNGVDAEALEALTDELMRGGGP